MSNIPHTGKITKHTILDVIETHIQVVGELILKVYSVENWYWWASCQEYQQREVKLNLGAYYYIELKSKKFCDYNLSKGLGFMY